MIDKILEQTYKWEKGFDNDPADKGGMTLDGITWTHFQQNAATVLSKPPILRIFKTMDKADILKFYNRIYARCGCDKIQNPAVAACCFDFAVNSQFGKREVQRVLRNVFKKEISADNIFGLATIGALNEVSATEGGAKKLVTAILDARQAYVQALVDRIGSQEKFLKGWTNRINDMRVFCADILEKSTVEPSVEPTIIAENGLPTE
jgi:lysozyme family protein